MTKISAATSPIRNNCMRFARSDGGASKYEAVAGESDIMV
jgi:hypothetical protein